MKRLAEDLWCKLCEKPESLRFTVSEEMKGIVSIIRVQCQECKSIITVETSTKNSKDGLYNTHKKLAVGKKSLLLK